MNSAVPEESRTEILPLRHRYPAAFLCPLALKNHDELQPMQDPVVAPDGFSYERDRIVRYLRTIPFSPLSGVAMPPNSLLRPNTDVFNGILRAGVERETETHIDHLPEGSGQSEGPNQALKLQKLICEDRERKIAGELVNITGGAELAVGIVQLRHDTVSSWSEKIDAWEACCCHTAIPDQTVYNAFQCLLALQPFDDASWCHRSCALARIARHGHPSLRESAHKALHRDMVHIDFHQRASIVYFLSHG